MGSGFRTFQSGEVLTADNVQNYLMDQAVMVFSGTAARSSALPSPETGMVAYSTATGLEVFNGTSWEGVGSKVLDVEFLLVGGGGGGGAGGGGVASGGGGGGGFVTGSGIIGKTTYTVKVGAGGAAGPTSTSSGGDAGKNGTASSFIGSANGGGFGAGGRAVVVFDGGSGGSGGGGGETGGAGGVGISGEGNNGASAAQGGGGGGAGSASTSGTGGAGSSNSYTGLSITYSAGGNATGGAAGGPNTGNGGQGSGSTTGSAGGAGGSGRVVVRWLTADAAGLSISVTGTTTNGIDGSYTWYAWDSTGTLVVA